MSAHPVADADILAAFRDLRDARDALDEYAQGDPRWDVLAEVRDAAASRLDALVRTAARERGDAEREMSEPRS